MRAELAVEGALNVLRVLSGEGYANKMMQGAPPASRTKAGSLIKNNSTGRFEFSTSSGAKGDFLCDDWFSKLSRAAGFLICAMSSTLIGLIDPVCCSHLRQRFLDALTWYGQGVTELLPSAKIIKYVAALERIVVTGKIKDGQIKDTVAERVALLCCELDPVKYEQLEKDTANTYDFRSRLMHGDYSPISEELAQVSAFAEHIARLTIQNAIMFYISIEQRTPSANAKKLEEEFLALRALFQEDKLMLPDQRV
jgi:hypothetical protein